MMLDLFDAQQAPIQLADGAYYLKGFARPIANTLCTLLQAQLAEQPPQKMITPMGYMSVLTSSLGHVGWVSSRSGYGYVGCNPANQQAWPAIPKPLLHLASRAAQTVGYKGFVPDCCLVNVYNVGSKMGLHQDKDERDFSQPVVSISLGIPAIFLMGGTQRNDKTTKVNLAHGDVVVFGGTSRLFFHGVQTVKQANHPLLGQQRINLTFRKAM